MTPDPLPAAEPGTALKDRIQASRLDLRAGRLAEAAARLQPASDIPEPAWRAEAATLLSRIARRQGQLDAALLEAGRAVEAATLAGHASAECRARVQHAHALNALGLIDPALEQSYHALRLARTQGDPATEASALEALAGVQWAMGQWGDCLASFQRMLALATTAGDLELQMVASGGLGGAERGSADGQGPAERLACLARASLHEAQYLNLATRLGDVFGMRSARHNHAVTLCALDELAAARAVLESLQEEMPDDASRALALVNLAEIDMKEARAQEAVERLEHAHALLQGVEDTGYLAPCCLALSQAHEALGQCQAALDWHRRYHAHYVRLASDQAQMHARALAVRHETSQAHAQAAFERERAERFAQDALQDDLTRLANRRSFDQALALAVEAARQGHAFGLALLDIDNFKQINDAHSHQAGDEVLRRVARILAANTRRGDLAARYGGEEFALVLNKLQEPATVAQACERARRAIEQEDWSALAPRLQVRISAGCLHVDPGRATEGAASLLAQVDRRLYAAKSGGRNRVVDTDLG